MRHNGHRIEYLMENRDGTTLIVPSAVAFQKWPKKIFYFLEWNIQFERAESAVYHFEEFDNNGQNGQPEQPLRITCKIIRIQLGLK